MNIGVTGCIGSGKSLVCHILAELTAGEYCDTDMVCRDLLAPNKSGWQGVVNTWGDAFLLADGSINRPLLRTAVFSDKKIKIELENILHPLVRQHVDVLLQQNDRQDKVLIVEVPLLFEVGWQDVFQQVITVFADRKTCMKRIMKRDGLSSGEAGRMIDSQMPIEEKKAMSDYVVDNSGKKEQTSNQVRDILRHLNKNKLLKLP